MAVPSIRHANGRRRNLDAHSTTASRRALLREQKRLRAAITTITFADNGQDFLEWDIDADGIVVDSRPYQKRIWAGYRVVNADLRVGDYVHYQHPHKPWPHPSVICYPVIGIRKKEAGP